MKRRNIAVFFDGTNQNRSMLPPQNWSNVVLLHDALVGDNGEDVVQSRKYIDGVGIREGEKITGGGFGIDLDRRIEEAYEFLWQEVNNAREDGEDPHVYLFGFSRGAYAARWLASLIQFSGIPKGDDAPRHKMFANHLEDRKDKAEKFREEGSARAVFLQGEMCPQSCSRGDSVRVGGIWVVGKSKMEGDLWQ